MVSNVRERERESDSCYLLPAADSLEFAVCLDSLTGRASSKDGKEEEKAKIHMHVSKLGKKEPRVQEVYDVSPLSASPLLAFIVRCVSDIFTLYFPRYTRAFSLFASALSCVSSSCVPMLLTNHRLSLTLPRKWVCRLKSCTARLVSLLLPPPPPLSLP